MVAYLCHHLANNYDDLLDLYVVSFLCQLVKEKISQQLVAQKSIFYIVLMSPTAIYLSAYIRQIFI